MSRLKYTSIQKFAYHRLSQKEDVTLVFCVQVVGYLRLNKVPTSGL